MPEFVTLKRFDAQRKHFHIYKIKSTALDHQSHYHDYYQICYVVSGEILHLQNAQAVNLTAGDAFIVPPGFTHSLHFNNAYAEIFSLSFEEALFPPGFNQSGAYHFLSELHTAAAGETANAIRLKVSMNQPQQKTMESLMGCLIQQQKQPHPPGLSIAPSIVSAAIYLLAQSYYLQRSDGQDYEERDQYGGTILHCIDYIDEHYKEDLSPADLTKRFGISRSILFAVFPQFAGMPLRKYISFKRIKEAQMQIRTNPEKPLSQIAMDVGFRDDSTFYRNFLKHTGVSPAKYRAIHKAE